MHDLINGIKISKREISQNAKVDNTVPSLCFVLFEKQVGL
jgi:hypothetical protein